MFYVRLVTNVKYVKEYRNFDPYFQVFSEFGS